MAKVYISWTDEQVQFLNNSFRTMSPKDMSESLGFTRQKVVNKMSKLGISSMFVIDQEQTKRMVNMLLELGLANNDVAVIVDTSLNIVDKVSRVRRYENRAKEKLKRKTCSFNKTQSSAEELKRLELNNFIPKHDENQTWNYIDLSPSEKLIYHFPISDYLINFKTT